MARERKGSEFDPRLTHSDGRLRPQLHRLHASDGVQQDGRHRVQQGDELLVHRGEGRTLGRRGWNHWLSAVAHVEGYGAAVGFRWAYLDGEDSDGLTLRPAQLQLWQPELEVGTLVRVSGNARGPIMHGDTGRYREIQRLRVELDLQ